MSSLYQSDDAVLDKTPASAVSGGDITQTGDGAAAIYPTDLAASEQGSVQVEGIVKIDAASATTWSDGDELWFDSSTEQAVKKSNALDGSADFRLGVAFGAKVNGTTFGYVRLNAKRPQLDPIVYEFDCDGDNGDTDSHVLIPAEMNPNGLLILGIYAVVTEQMAGSSEDQGVVTVSDESDNALATLTASDAAADAVGDIVVGYAAAAATTGDAAVTVAAGEYVDAAVTQQTSGGTPAGKMKVYVHAIPLV